MHKAVVLIPSYNSGIRLKQTIAAVMASCDYSIIVVIDGSTDGSDSGLQDDERLTIVRHEENRGKGAAVRTGLDRASENGFTHALAMDADGQHPEQEINRFLETSRSNPDAMILGQPVFDSSVPIERLHGRKLSVWLVKFEAMSSAIGDPLYGFRVYPIEPLRNVMSVTWRSNRYDFDPEVAVRLHWNGVPTVKLDAPVRYLSKEEGGISHFHYVRDNVRFVWLHTRLIVETIIRLPCLLFRGKNNA